MDSSSEQEPTKQPPDAARDFGSGSFVPPPEDPREKSSLGELEKKLYRPGQDTNFERHRSRLSRTPLNKPHIPFSPREAARALEEKAQDREPFLSPLLKKILLAALLVFCVVAGVFGYVYFGGGMLGVSSQAVAITVAGPVSAPGGSPVSFELTFQNNGAELVESNAIITFPAGTRSALDPTKELPRLIENIGPLKKGESRSQIVRAIFFGGENAEKEISVEYSFRSVGSNATYQKTKEYSFKLTGSPITLGTTLPESSVSGRELSFDIKVTSNATLGLNDILVSAAYPPGFSFVRSTPEPALANNIWSVGDMNPGQVRIVHVEGVLEGEDSEEKLFRFESGGAKGGALAIAAPYGALVEDVVIERPPLSASLFVGGSSAATPSIEDGDDARVLVTLANNTTSPLEDISLMVKLSGELIDKANVAASKGFYQSSNNTIRWDKSTYPELAELGPGEAIDLDFLVGTLSANRTGGIVVNPKISIDATARATRIVPGSGASEAVFEISRPIHISTLAAFGARALYSVGPFKNTGPYPPKSEKETSYTVTWTLANTANALSRASVRATLPTYITWAGVHVPQTENMVWNEAAREIVWNVGDVAAKTGYAGSPRSVSFQIRFMPSQSQRGVAPVLVDNQRFEATDSFTNARIEGIKNALTTELLTDPIFTGEGKVGQ